MINEAKKLQFKAELELGLKSPSDIQEWALNTLEKANFNKLALEICFLSNSEQVVCYFDQITKTDFNICIKKEIIVNLLDQYIFTNFAFIQAKDKISFSFEKI